MPSRVAVLLAIGGMTMRFFKLIFFTQSGDRRSDNVSGASRIDIVDAAFTRRIRLS
jgi:hypothetical protein